MNSLVFLLTAGILVSYLGLPHSTGSALGLFAVLRDELTPIRDEALGLEDSVREEPASQISDTVNNEDSDNDDQNEEDADFENDDDDDLQEGLVGLEPQNVNSVTHLHQKRGEILVPCFGMWWPVGGGGGGSVTYDYIEGDYYDDYRRKRKRAKKQKKAAKMKKRKKA